VGVIAIFMVIEGRRIGEISGSYKVRREGLGLNLKNTEFQIGWRKLRPPRLRKEHFTD
jgi:hypothetical protein